MNAVIDAIMSRRTVKRMEPDRTPVRADIELIIEAATWAPNHHSTEPWRFVVLEGQARDRLGEAMAAALSGSLNGAVDPQRLEVEKNKPLSAPVVVTLICAPKKGDIIVHQEEVVAAGAALQNMLLAAHSLGLATSVKTGAHAYSPLVRRFFEMKEDEVLAGMVYIGYASGAVAPGKRTHFRDRVTWQAG